MKAWSLLTHTPLLSTCPQRPRPSVKGLVQSPWVCGEELVVSQDLLDPEHLKVGKSGSQALSAFSPEALSTVSL